MKVIALFLPWMILCASIEEDVGELFVIPICPKREEAHWIEVKKIMEKYHISSVIIKQATPKEQFRVLDFIGPTFFVFQDAEWGLGMRMEEVPTARRRGEASSMGESIRRRRARAPANLDRSGL